MKSLYNKRGARRGDGERHQYAFFAVGAIVILAVVFVIGLQVGRVIEKKGTPATGQAPVPAGGAAGNEIRRDLGAFSEEAARVPVVPPPDARTSVNEVEKRLTFQETLSKKDATPVPLVRSPKEEESAGGEQAARPNPPRGRKTLVQAGAFRDRETAEIQRKRLEKAGFAPKIVRSRGKGGEKVYFRVLIGPFPDGGSAGQAVRRIKGELKMEAFLVSG